MKRRMVYFVGSPSLGLILFVISPAWAQVEIGDYTIGGEAEVGGLPQSRTGKDARFEEYRDLRENVIVPQLQLIIGGKKEDFYLHLDASEVGRDDQNYKLRVGRYGLLDMEFEWDQIPHLFSKDTARTPYAMTEGHTTFFSLFSKPSATTATTSCATSPICQWVNSNAHDVDLKLFNGIGRFNLRYTPTPGWTFTGTYWSNHNIGERAFGTLFASSPGSFNVTELTEPINYQTHNIELGGEYAGKGWSLGLKYTASLFNNANSNIVWDNPLNLTGVGAACVDSAVYNNAAGTGPCRGRLDLYPSNQAHTFTLSGAATLPFKSHFMGTASYGWRLQDDSFLPFTINSAICPNPSTCFPSRRSLGGDVRPLMVNATLVNNFFERLNLKIYERFYDLGNHNKTVVEPNGFISNDQGAFKSPGVPVTPERFAYSKNNIGAEGAYEFTHWLSGKLSYGWERMHRQDREVSNTDEHSFGPTIDIKPSSAVLFRVSYKHFWRNSPDYQAAPDVDASNVSRKFDEAARGRDKSSLFVQVAPWDRLMISAGFEFTKDRYLDAILGTQNDINYSPSVGFVYTPSDWLKLFADYNWDRYDWLLHAEDRTSTVTQTPANSCFPNVAVGASRCWSSRGRDQVHTISLGSDMDLIPKLLGFRIQYTYSNGRSEVHASGDPAGTPATNYPPVENQWHEVLARFEYKLTKNWTMKFGYYFNHATEQDKGVDIMQPWMGNVDIFPTPNASTARSIFLGDQIKGPFTAHVGFVTLRFRF